MSIINLAIFFLTLKIIDTTTPPQCKGNQNCQCMPSSSEGIQVVCNVNNDPMFTMDIKYQNSLEITCKDWRGWKDFNFKENLPGKTLNSLQFKHCGLSDEISLKNVVKQLGVEETNSLIFQSYKNLGVTLKREYLGGFHGVKKLILSNNGFTNITSDCFWDFPDLEWLELIQNSFLIPAYIFNSNTNLKRLELGYNELTLIEPGMFDKLEKLEFLHLMGNELTQIKDGIFDNLLSLVSLDLSENKLLELPQKIFYKLKYLEGLDLSFNNFSHIQSDLFSENKHLQILRIHDNARNLTTLPDNLLAHFAVLREVDLSKTGLSVLPENIFWDSTSLKTILLNNNFFFTLPRDIFKGLRTLEKLEISNNRIVTLPDGIFHDLINLIQLDLSRNRIVSIPKNTFESLTLLASLNMERNQLIYIHEEALSVNKELRSITFSHNQLTLNETGQPWSIFHFNDLLYFLDLSYNKIPTFFIDWSIGNYHLRFLNLSHNEITSVMTQYFLSPADIMQIDLTYNKISSINLDLIDQFSSATVMERDVYVYIEHNPLLCDCEFYKLLLYFKKLLSEKVYRFIKFIAGNLTCISPNGKGETDITQLNLKTYKCYERDFFHVITKCQINCTCWVTPDNGNRIIDCSYKNMTQFWFNEKKVYLVENSSIILDLTGNKLKEIPSIKPLESMSVTGLLLSNNNISSIMAEKLPKTLKILELHNNKISMIGPEEINALSLINFDEITLSGNLINCDCSHLTLLHYVKKLQSRHKDLSNLRCKDMYYPMYRMADYHMCSFALIAFYLTIAVLSSTITFIYYYYHYYKNRSTDDDRSEVSFEYHAAQAEE